MGNICEDPQCAHRSLDDSTCLCEDDQCCRCGGPLKWGTSGGAMSRYSSEGRRSHDIPRLIESRDSSEEREANWKQTRDLLGDDGKFKPHRDDEGLDHQDYRDLIKNLFGIDSKNLPDELRIGKDGKLQGRIGNFLYDTAPEIHDALYDSLRAAESPDDQDLPNIGGPYEVEEVVEGSTAMGERIMRWFAETKPTGLPVTSKASLALIKRRMENLRAMITPADLDDDHIERTKRNLFAQNQGRSQANDPFDVKEVVDGPTALEERVMRWHAENEATGLPDTSQALLAPTVEALSKALSTMATPTLIECLRIALSTMTIPADQDDNYKERTKRNPFAQTQGRSQANDPYDVEEVVDGPTATE